MGIEELVAGWLRKHGKTQKHIDEDKKSANWKIVLARELRKQTSATNPWIAQRLKMGHLSNVSRHFMESKHQGLNHFARTLPN